MADCAVGDQVVEPVGERFGLGHHHQRGDCGDPGDHEQVDPQRWDEPDEPDVNRTAPVDVGHRWTIGRCWVPIRLRNTQYVHPWYSSTTGVITKATIVITFKV